MRSTNICLRGVAFALFVAWAGTAIAHHSFEMFDRAKNVSLTGTVKEFQWTNPHCWIQLMVLGADGRPVEWGIELDSPRSLIRTGWKPHLIKPGDNITVVIHPKRDGSDAGGYLSGTAADGSVLPPKGK
jgi:Family of unknown function (DUF6152)